MDVLRDEVIQYLERTTDREIQYTSVSPSVLRYLDIRDMKILAKEEPRESILAITRIRVYYNIFALLGRNPQTAFSRVSIEDSTLSFDLDEDKDLIELVKNMVALADNRVDRPNLVVSGRNLSVAVKNESFEASIERLFFDIDTGPDLLAIELDGEMAVTPLSALDYIGNVHANVDISGTLARDLSDATMKIGLAKIASETASLARQTFQLTVAQRTWRLTKIQDRLPVDFTITYDTNLKILLAQYAASDFVPSSLLTLEDIGEDISPWMDIKLTGNGEVRYLVETSDLSFSGFASTNVPISIGPLSDISVQGVFRGTPALLHLSDVRADTSHGGLGFDGTIALNPLIPSGRLSVQNFSWPLNRLISGSMQISENDGTYLIDDGNLLVDGIELDNLQASATTFEEEIEFTLEGVLGRESPLQIVGSFETGGENVLEASVSLKDLPLDIILDKIEEFPESLPDYITQLRIDADAFVRTDFDRYSFSVPAFLAHDRGGDYRLSARMSGNNSAINITDLVASWQEIEVLGTAEIRIENLSSLELSATLGAFNQTYSIEGLLSNGSELSFTGNYGLSGTFELDGKKANITVQSTDLPVPYKENVYFLSLNADGYFLDKDHWSFKSESSTIHPIPLLTLGDAEIGFTGTAEPGLIKATHISLVDQFSEISGPAELSYALNPIRRMAGDFYLSDAELDEQYELTFTLGGDVLDAEARFEHAMLERLGDLPVAGRLSGAAHIWGALDSLNADALVSVENGSFNGDRVELETAMYLDQKHIEFADLSIDYLSNRIRSANGSMTFSDGLFSVAAEYAGAIQDRPLSFDLSIDGAFDMPIDRSDFSVIPQMGFSAAVAASNVTLGQSKIDTWQFLLSQRDDVISVRGGPEDAIRAEFKKDQTFSLVLDKPLPLSVTARGALKGGSVEAELIDVELDMERVESVFTIPFFNIASGVARGNLRVSGRINDPDIYGMLIGRDLLATVPVVPEIIGPFTAQLSFQGKTLLINEAVLPVGGGRVLGTVDFTLDHWLPRMFDVQLATLSNPGIHIKHNFSGIDIDGYANGDLTVTGDPVAIEVAGKLEITSTTIIIAEKPPKKKGGSNLVVNLDFVTGKQVSFLWPNRTLPIVNSFTDTGQLLKLRSNPLAGTLSIDGDMAMRGGEIFFFQRTFYLREGSILFQEDQNRFDPRITVRAESRHVDQNGDDLRIYLVMENQPFSQFTPRFESSPPMSTTDIYAVLGQDLRNDMGGDFGLSSAVILTTDILGQFGFLRTVERGVRNLLSLDLFSIRTSILQNIISERILPGGGILPSGTTSIGKYLDNTTLFLGKYFGNDLFVEAMVRLRTNQALLSNLDARDDLYVDSEIRLEWKTPLFLIELSLLPNLVDPLSSITNAKLGLFWGFSY